MDSGIIVYPQIMSCHYSNFQYHTSLHDLSPDKLTDKVKFRNMLSLWSYWYNANKLRCFKIVNHCVERVTAEAEALKEVNVSLALKGFKRRAELPVEVKVMKVVDRSVED